MNLVSRDSSRATIIFCWLPPDRLPARSKIDDVRTSKSTANPAEFSFTAFQFIAMPREYGCS